MDKEQLKELIQEIYDDYDFVEFNLHFVDCVEPHKVYEIKNLSPLTALRVHETWWHSLQLKINFHSLVCTSFHFSVFTFPLHDPRPHWHNNTGLQDRKIYSRMH